MRSSTYSADRPSASVWTCTVTGANSGRASTLDCGMCHTPTPITMAATTSTTLVLLTHERTSHAIIVGPHRRPLAGTVRLPHLCGGHPFDHGAPSKHSGKIQDIASIEFRWGAGSFGASVHTPDMTVTWQCARQGSTRVCPEPDAARQIAHRPATSPSGA